jgi:hypothetical protein
VLTLRPAPDAAGDARAVADQAIGLGRPARSRSANTGCRRPRSCPRQVERQRLGRRDAHRAVGVDERAVDRRLVVTLITETAALTPTTPTGPPTLAPAATGIRSSPMSRRP